MQLLVSVKPLVQLEAEKIKHLFRVGVDFSTEVELDIIPRYK